MIIFILYSCARNAIDGQLLWHTIDVDGTVVQTLYDTAVGDPLPQGYNFVNEGDDLVFDLEVTVSKTTAILTRCTVTEEGKDTVSATAMFYLISTPYPHLYQYSKDDMESIPV